MSDTRYYQIAVPPPPEGFLHIVPGYVIAVSKMPRRYQQWMMRVFFGWLFTKNDL